MTQADLSNEWMLLQNQYDSYEKYSLVIKLLAMIVFYFAHISEKIGWIIVLLLAVDFAMRRFLGFNPIAWVGERIFKRKK